MLKKTTKSPNIGGDYPPRLQDRGDTSPASPLVVQPTQVSNHSVDLGLNEHNQYLCKQFRSRPSALPAARLTCPSRRVSGALPFTDHYSAHHWRAAPVEIESSGATIVTARLHFNRPRMLPDRVFLLFEQTVLPEDCLLSSHFVPMWLVSAACFVCV